MPERNQFQIFYEISRAASSAASKIDRGFYRMAYRDIQSAMLLDQNNSKILYLSALCDKQFGNLKESESKKQLAYKLNPCFFQCLQYNQSKILQKITQIFEKMAKNIQPDPNQVNEIMPFSEYVNLSDIHQRQFDMQSSLMIYKASEQYYSIKDAEEMYCSITLAMNYYQLGYYQLSYKYFQICMRLTPSSYSYLNNSAIVKYVLGQYEESVQFVQRALAIKPGYAKCSFILSFCYAKMGRYDQSLQQIMKAVQKTRQSLHYLFKLITTLLLYFPAEIPKIKLRIATIIKILRDNDDSDRYFVNALNKPFLQHTVKFISDNFMHVHNKQADQIKWKQYVDMIDQYLLVGHIGKCQIRSKIKQVQKEFMDSVNKDNQEGQIQEIQKKQINHVQPPVRQAQETDFSSWT